MNKNFVFRSTVLSLVAAATLTACTVTSAYAVTRIHTDNDDAGVYKRYKSQFEYKSSISESGKVYETSEAEKNVIIAKSGYVNFSNSTITKVGGVSRGEDPEFFGINAAVLAAGDSKIKVLGGSISTNAEHADAAFAIGDATIDVSDLTISTVKENSSALAVTDGGTALSDNANMRTSGKISPVIYVGRGGGNVTVTGGKVVSDSSEAVSVDGGGIVSIEKADIEASNAIASDNSGVMRAFYMHKSKSNKQNVSILSVKNSKVTNQKGNIVFVAGTEANVSFSRNEIKNIDQSGALLYARDNSNVNFDVSLQQLGGNIVADNGSKVVLSFKQRVSYKGTINATSGGDVSLVLDDKSRVILTGDSYVKDLMNEAEGNKNIYSNGYHLYVNGVDTEINKDAPEDWVYDYSTETTEPVVEPVKKDKTMLFALLIGASAAFLISLASVIMIIKRNKKAKRRKKELEVISKASRSTLRKPWERA